MIDEKINNTLKELELGLKNIDSARKQVEKTVNSYDELNGSTKEYISMLGLLTTQIKELVNSIGNDYNQKVVELEKDRRSIIESVNNASNKLSESTVKFKESLNNVESKLKQCMIINVVTIILMVIILFFVI